MKRIIMLICMLLLYCCRQPPGKDVEQTPPLTVTKAATLPVKPAPLTAKAAVVKEPSFVKTPYVVAAPVVYPENMSRRQYKLYKRQIKAQAQVSQTEAKYEAKINKPPGKVILKDKRKVKVDNSQKTTSGFPWWLILLIALAAAYFFFKPKWL